MIRIGTQHGFNLVGIHSGILMMVNLGNVLDEGLRIGEEDIG
jgi:hypothetical protein